MALSADSARTGATTDRTLNKLAFAIANKADDITTATTSDRVIMVDASADYAVKYADGDNILEMAGITSTATELNILDGVTATAAEINAAADVSGRVVSVTDADTAISAANSGKPHLVANVSADRTFTLPSAAAGLDFEFIATVGAADGHDWIISTGSDTNFFLGAVTHLDSDANSAADEIVSVAPNGSSNSKLQVNLPEGNTVIRCICDGTNWTVMGQAVSTTAPTFANQ